MVRNGKVDVKPQKYRSYATNPGDGNKTGQERATAAKYTLFNGHIFSSSILSLTLLFDVL